ncbi:chromosome segregation protein SMC [Paraglaciecola aestuariivivens]
MRLKKIKLAGFKSFVDPTTIPFPDDMTAVVGPNGCGKSNVIDAVRWVLGESSAKNLRGDAMTDVIFNGSSARKPVSQCSVELVFDNSSGRIQGEYAGYNELSVKRIVTKDAQSSYLLNHAKCRRRDVTDLFLGTGLGPRSYAIIEQGMISRLIESKPQELRVFIEEAAGVSKYKERRRETENRIRHTKENLERLEDVRGELGQQLEKLQRQAAAAKKFKDLKQQERQYKAQLAALRWVKHNDSISRLEAEIEQKNGEIEAYVSAQRNEEKDIIEFKQQQQDLKQQLSDIQQQVFKVGSDISRIEQNQIHTKQRRQQIEQEIKALKQSIEESENHQQQNQAKVLHLKTQLNQVEPEKALLEEEVEQAQSALLDAEEQMQNMQHQWRLQDQQLNQQKQQVQQYHGQIQSLLSMQMRTQQRIQEIDQEISELTDQQLTQQIESCQNDISQLEQQLAPQQRAQTQAKQQCHDAGTKLEQVKSQLLNTKGQQQSLEAQLAALTTLQQSVEQQNNDQQQLDELQLNHQAWWQSLDIQECWELAFETLTQDWQQAVLIDEPNRPSELASMPGNKWLFLSDFSQTAVAGSIASKLNNQQVPSWLNTIFVADNLSQGLELLGKLTDSQSVICQDGLWLGKDWMVVGSASDQNSQQSGRLIRAKQINTLTEQKAQIEERVSVLTQEVAQAKTALDIAQQNAEQCQNQLDATNQALQQQQHQLHLLNQQKEQGLQRHQKLLNEREKQQDTASQENLQLEELALKVEELEQTLEETQSQQLQSETQREQQQNQLSHARTQLDAKKNGLHQLALTLHSVQSQYQVIIESQTRDQDLLTNMQEKHSILEAEFAELALPLEEQQENLQVLLEQKAELSLLQQDVQEQLTVVEEKLLTAEKGQQGVTDKIQSMLTELQSIKIECEGVRVRAKGLLEQLQEMQQNIDSLVQSLPQEATEAGWQTLLDKTTSAVSRLGAVNLAAVEEYESQAERKKHLDEQNTDLVSALEILEQAIRKIDKETRSRFKETFDQVNDDLKTLFPKVFGGGSAYLELTDDDLLETGVTIMARPPGKKNSTIHLLSGGEKALTALSLVFAIFRLNPAPFCLLDEVDAPLDDANVGRFCKLVSEMSKTVQFIYITHNKIAMEMATHLTGVTMAEPGVSRMVAVDVDEAVAIAQA